MSFLLLTLTLLVLAGAGFVLGRSRALRAAGGDTRQLHSLPRHYGWHAVLWCLAPALAVLVIWLIAQPLVVEGRVAAMLPAGLSATEQTLQLQGVSTVAQGVDLLLARDVLDAGSLPALDASATDIRGLLNAAGVALVNPVTPEVWAAALAWRDMQAMGLIWRTIAVIAVAVAGLAVALRQTTPALRARNRVEQAGLALLAVASGVAILTTVGIVMSMLTESLRFFSMYPVQDFLFGLTWSPNFRGSSQLGLLPLLWGTLYISLIALVVAIPLGIFAAIYLAEYASDRARNIIKPLIEIIAGIPTVVFGIFALVTLGPFLRDWFAQPLGLGNSGSSVMTAGIVIGILNVPFISSLADDIISAVPQALRDGSYGLGATKSETIKQVVLPAALPGIVGACLMAASRAIGETMIVTMGAGAAARMDLNPFEAMTTITVKIVSQLTGDNAFDTPETLVAFALGITLFVITLCLNIWALWIVRKYREQYE